MSEIDLQWLGSVPYERAWAIQRERHASRSAGGVGDAVLLLEHPPVYTAGRRSEPWERPADGTPVVDVDRGGKITWHGPGQLVGYPIVRLPPLSPARTADPRSDAAEGHARPGAVDVVAYVRTLEEALIRSCGRLGLATGRVPGRSGVWTADGRRKVAAIGVRVARGVTMHGIALNCDCDLRWFTRIVPCGITDAGVSSLSAELRRPVTVADALPVVGEELRAVLGAALDPHRGPAAVPAADRAGDVTAAVP